eukprot:TRINITY_DN13615_c2_g1_i1.p1 TRINITY_DN13615_c2_g1~~TRINITY_DN13615_c2_g1_i1.p1  ORF type:complete len:217 (+),score=104.10 TRINITY_DN13615_c2_g1_i1:53-703(+)
MPKIKKGFKVDRLKSKNDPAKLRKGRRGKEAAERAAKEAVQASSGTQVARPKVIKFDTDSMKDYITGFHLRKNVRRMQAMKKVKDDHRAQVNSERKERRESRRLVYNTISQFPINEEFRLVMPGQEEGDSDEDVDGGRYTETYAGQNEESMVDVEVEELDLTGTGRVRASRDDASSDDDDDDDESAEAPMNPLFASAAAFPTNGAPTKVRLVRKRK